MEVKCPECSSRFNLADEVVRTNAKFRCSVCKNVFTLEASLAEEPPVNAPTDAPADAPMDDSGDSNLDLDSSAGDASLDLDSSSKGKKPKNKKNKIITLVIILLVLCGGGAGGFWYYINYMSAPVPQDAAALAKSVELMTMRNVRQYYVENEKIGSVFVIEGLVVNEFPAPKDLIEVEAAIYGKDKNTLMLKKQLAGTVLSLFQLQVLGEEELESFLTNQIEILSRNTNVPPNGEVPFMVLFYNPPPDVAEFGVKIISAKDVEAE